MTMDHWLPPHFSRRPHCLLRPCIDQIYPSHQCKKDTSAWWLEQAQAFTICCLLWPVV